MVGLKGDGNTRKGSPLEKEAQGSGGPWWTYDYQQPGCLGGGSRLWGSVPCPPCPEGPPRSRHKPTSLVTVPAQEWTSGRDKTLWFKVLLNLRSEFGNDFLQEMV